jgi:hypothetical protein
MPLPRTIRVGPMDLPVVWQDEIIFKGEDCDGAYDGERIMLRKDLRANPGRLLDTVLHEVIHAIGRCLDLRLSEQQVRLLAHALATLIVDNPRLTRWLSCRD